MLEVGNKTAICCGVGTEDWHPNGKGRTPHGNSPFHSMLLFAHKQVAKIDSFVPNVTDVNKHAVYR